MLEINIKKLIIIKINTFNYNISYIYIFLEKIIFY